MKGIIINIENGDFGINLDIIIRKGCLYSDIHDLFPQNKIRDLKNGYKWIYFKILSEDSIFDVGVCFKNEKLNSIDFSFHKQNSKQLTWNDWSEQSEISLKTLYEEWLTSSIGKKRNFEWGKIRSYYDPKSGTAGIYINYK